VYPPAGDPDVEVADNDFDLLPGEPITSTGITAGQWGIGRKDAGATLLKPCVGGQIGSCHSMWGTIVGGAETGRYPLPSKHILRKCRDETQFGQLTGPQTAESAGTFRPGAPVQPHTVFSFVCDAINDGYSARAFCSTGFD
jgi:hypothetical protein